MELYGQTLGENVTLQFTTELYGKVLDENVTLQFGSGMQIDALPDDVEAEGTIGCTFAGRNESSTGSPEQIVGTGKKIDELPLEIGKDTSADPMRTATYAPDKFNALGKLVINTPTKIEIRTDVIVTESRQSTERKVGQIEVLGTETNRQRKQAESLVLIFHDKAESIAKKGTHV